MEPKNRIANQATRAISEHLLDICSILVLGADTLLFRAACYLRVITPRVASDLPEKVWGMLRLFSIWFTARLAVGSRPL